MVSAKVANGQAVSPPRTANSLVRAVGSRWGRAFGWRIFDDLWRMVGYSGGVGRDIMRGRFMVVARGDQSENLRRRRLRKLP